MCTYIYKGTYIHISLNQKFSYACTVYLRPLSNSQATIWETGFFLPCTWGRVWERVAVFSCSSDPILHLSPHPLLYRAFHLLSIPPAPELIRGPSYVAMLLSYLMFGSVFLIMIWVPTGLPPGCPISDLITYHASYLNPGHRKPCFRTHSLPCFLLLWVAFLWVCPSPPSGVQITER